VSKPAKDEAELIAQITDTLSSNSLGFTHRGQAARVLAAIRAAGWAVVPVEPTWKMIRVMDNYDDMMQDETTIQLWKDTLAAATGVKP
jgi:hypothetical protein